MAIATPTSQDSKYDANSSLSRPLMFLYFAQSFLGLCTSIAETLKQPMIA